MKRLLFILIAAVMATSCFAIDMKARNERKALVAGNAAYRDKKYDEALAKYNEALKLNPSNITALFNKALATTRIADALSDKEARRKAELMGEAAKEFESVAKHTSDNPELAARAQYNRGNISLKNKEYPEAIEFYKNALRLNPNDDQARRNLRIAQQNLPKQQQNKDNKNNQDKNKDKQDQQDKNKDKNKNQDQDKNQNQDKDKNQDKEQQQQQPQSSPQKQDMSNQAADRLLKRSADKENQTRRKFTLGGPHTSRSKGW